jgi:capsular exopolysaccharide synthesis family protein
MFLLQKLEENYVNQTAINPTVKVLSAASGSSKPIAPKRVQIFILALAIGFMIPVVIVFLLETSDTRIHSKRDLSLLQCAYVGELPEMEREKKCSNRKKRGDKSQDWVVKEDGNDFVNEAFRMVRTNLNFMLSGGGDSKKVLMSTSFLPGVGKTFVLMNLGTAFALQGKRVLLIDLDMRKSSLSRQVHKPLRGISEYLNGSELNLDAIKIKNVSCEGLELIPVGVEPPNPTELLSNSTRLSELFDTVRSEYDYILVDCPPFNMVADSMLVNSYVDITMFVLRAEISDRSQVDELNRVQAEGPLRHLAVLLNGVKPKKLYYYRKKYKYGYGYGYVKK